MTDADAMRFAHEWAEAWNSHDLDRILDHYADDVTLTSPLVSRILGDGQHTVSGRQGLQEYFRRGLEAYPDLRFALWGVYAGVDSVVVHYQSVRGLRAAELMKLDAHGRVHEVVAHYAPPSAAPHEGSH